MVALAGVAAAGLPIILAPAIAAAATAASVPQAPCVAACTARFVSDGELQRASVARATVSHTLLGSVGADGQTAVIVGPALGALVLLVASPAAAILINGLTFLVSAAAIAAIPAGQAFRPGGAETDAGAAGVLADIRVGARALHGAPTAIRLVLADVIGSAVYGLLTVTLVLVARRVGAGTGGYGLLLGAFGAGGVIGAILTARIEATTRWRRTLACALTLVGVTLAALGVAPTLISVLALALLGGGGMMVGEVLSETALPRVLEDAVLARAYGLVFPASIGGIVAGSLLAGPVVSLLGLTGALVAAGAAVLVAAALLLHRPLYLTVAPDLAEAPTA
jgi:Transmembrane secretion effector